MNVYLQGFRLPDAECEEHLLAGLHSTTAVSCYTTAYPYGLFMGAMPPFEFAPITILYGGNGCGKTTVLNVIAESLSLPRQAPFNRSPFFDRFLADCSFRASFVPDGSLFIGSDDVFLGILNRRLCNEENDRARDAALQRNAQYKKETGQGERESFRMKSLDDYQALCDDLALKRLTSSEYVRRNSAPDLREGSNGEIAFLYFSSAIRENALYLLDEPENSLSPSYQLELLNLLSASIRLGNQFVIATHSPLLLSLPGARIYDLDARPVTVKPWHELANPRLYYAFFKQYRELFEKE